MSLPERSARERLGSETPWPQSRRNTVVGISAPVWDVQTGKSKTSITHRTSFLNDLKRLTSIHQAVVQNQFLESLPRATKIFLLASVLDAVFILTLSIEQLVVVR